MDFLDEKAGRCVCGSSPFLTPTNVEALCIEGEDNGNPDDLWTGPEEEGHYPADVVVGFAAPGLIGRCWPRPH